MDILQPSINIAIGSKNPVKVMAATTGIKKALEALYRDTTELDKNIVINETGIDVKSGVPDQPIGDEETKLGAKNRATNVYQEYLAQNGKAPGYLNLSGPL